MEGNTVNVEKKEKRRYLRHPMCFPLTFAIVKNSFKKSPREKSESKNVSRGGLLFSAKKEAGKGSLIEIAIPFQDKIFKVRAKVVHCGKNTDTNLYDIGAEFMSTKTAFKVKLIEQMYLISEYRDLRSVQLGRELSLQEASREWVERYAKRFNRFFW